MQVILYNLGYLFSHALITYYFFSFKSQLDHIEKRIEKLKELLSCQTKTLLCQNKHLYAFVSPILTLLLLLLSLISFCML